MYDGFDILRSLILASHVILSAYGFWLPNDPRGSWSDFVGSWELFHYGPATKVTTRRSVASRPHSRALREAAKGALKYEPVTFSGVQARAVARGFADAVDRADIAIHACAILPDHVHLVVARHRHSIQQLVNFLKGCATKELLREGLHPFVDRRRPDGALPSVWASQYWKVYIDDPEHLEAAVRYVRKNPCKEGLVAKRWWFERPV